MNLTSPATGKRKLLSGCLWDLFASLPKYATRRTAPTLYLLSFLAFQFLFLLRNIADLNAAWFWFCF